MPSGSATLLPAFGCALQGGAASQALLTASGCTDVKPRKTQLCQFSQPHSRSKVSATLLAVVGAEEQLGAVSYNTSNPGVGEGLGPLPGLLGLCGLAAAGPGGFLGCCCCFSSGIGSTRGGGSVITGGSAGGGTVAGTAGRLTPAGCRGDTGTPGGGSSPGTS
jgi:hypothetical protein